MNAVNVKAEAYTRGNHFIIYCYFGAYPESKHTSKVGSYPLVISILLEKAVEQIGDVFGKLLVIAQLLRMDQHHQRYNP